MQLIVFSEKLIVTFMALLGWVPVFGALLFCVLFDLHEKETRADIFIHEILIVFFTFVVFILQCIGLYWHWTSKDHKYRRYFLHAPGMFGLISMIFIVLFFFFALDLFEVSMPFLPSV